jgi:hypothetical protein
MFGAPLITLALTAAPASASLLTVDYTNLIARADLHYSNAVDRIESGIPIGNGRMGTLIWTTPTALHFAINRVDVFGNDSTSTSFPQRHTDYCGGCGFVDIDFGGEAFPSNSVTQALSCYNALASVRGSGVLAQALVWNDQDVMAVLVSDVRNKPQEISVNLRMLRPPLVKAFKHIAASKLESSHGRIILTQEFAEGTYICRTAVAIAVVGADSTVRPAGEQELRLAVRPKQGSFTVLVSSAATFSRREDVVGTALSQLNDAAKKTFAGLVESNRDWWHNFWSKSFIHLHSEDGVADSCEQDYNYFLYLLASTSRGKFPVKFNGMLWSNGGDKRQWGGQFWGANQSCLYNNSAFAANHTELLDPMFDMYSGMFDSCATAAQQQWGSQGIWFPETVAFDGLAPLPTGIAAEMRDLYLIRKPWDQRSKQFLDYASDKSPYSSRWNWIGGGHWESNKWTITERGGGPFGPVTHTFSRGAKIAYQYWLRYEFTHDEHWLRFQAYPVIKGIAEFYRNFPNIKKEADGKYHINHVNSNESIQGARDTDEEISSMMGIFPVLVKASEILHKDADERPVWQEFLANLAPLPRSDDPNAAPLPATNTMFNAGANLGPHWIRGYPPSVRGATSARPDGNTMPEWFFDLCTLESDPAMFQLGSATLGNNGSSRRVGVLSKIPLTSAVMGRADAVQKLIPAQYNTNERGGILMNRMDLREGPQTTSAQRLGNASDALHTALLYDLPAGPAQPSIIHVFAAWPKQWDAEYTLLARDGFLVSSAMHRGEIQFVEIQPQLGGVCRLRNPWPGTEVAIWRNGVKIDTAKEGLLRIPTRKGEDFVVVPFAVDPKQFKQTVSP